MENIKLEMKIHAILNYYKLIKLENLTKNEKYDVFKLCGGEESFNNFINDYYEEEFEGINNNCDMSSKLKEYISLIVAGKYSYSIMLLKELRDSSWLNDVEPLIDGNENIFDTVIRNASSDVRRKLLVGHTVFDKKDASVNLVINSYLSESVDLVKKLK